MVPFFYPKPVIGVDDRSQPYDRFGFILLGEAFFSCCVDFFSYLCILWLYAATVFIIHLSLYVYD